jgi:hypothetical protein
MQLHEIPYTDPSAVSGIRTTAVPVSGQTVTGYGGAIPTQHMLRYLGVWRRVYVMVYSNSGTPYVKVHGATVVLDTDTAHTLQESE